MKALVQKVTQSSVISDGQQTALISDGIVILLGVTVTDIEKDSIYLADKISNFKFFDSDAKPFQKTLIDMHYKAVIVSQFTLYASTKKGTRPSFTKAMNAKEAKPLYDAFCERLLYNGVEIETGIFQSYMQVSLTNDGPLTLEFTSNQAQ